MSTDRIAEKELELKKLNRDILQQQTNVAGFEIKLDETKLEYAKTEANIVTSTNYIAQYEERRTVLMAEIAELKKAKEEAEAGGKKKQ